MKSTRDNLTRGRPMRVRAERASSKKLERNDNYAEKERP